MKNLPSVSPLTYEIMEEADRFTHKAAEWWKKYRQEERQLSAKEQLAIDNFICNTSLSSEELANLTPGDILSAIQDNK